MQQIGSAFVRLFVKKDELDKGLNEAKAQVNQAASEMNAAAGKASTGFSGVAKGLKDATKPARDFVGAITSTVGIFTRILGIVGLIGTAVGVLVTAWKSISEYGEKQAKSLREQIVLQREIGSLVSQATKDPEAALKRISDAVIDASTRVAELKRAAEEEYKANEYRGPFQTDDKIRAYNAAITELESLIKAQERAQQELDNKRVEDARKKVAEFEKYARNEAAKAEKDAAQESVKLREQQIEAARDAAREILDAAQEEQDILRESARIREQIHNEELRRIEERRQAEIAAIDEINRRNQSAINSIQSALGQGQISGTLSRIEQIIRYAVSNS